MYKTISQQAEGIYKEKGSKFLAFAYPVKTLDEFKKLKYTIEKQYYDASHRCFAYRIGVENETIRFNDDGEPSNTAGKPILGQIYSYNLTNIMIYVVRYFGGTKLGVSGLIHAYKSAAGDALNKAEIIAKYLENVYVLKFQYDEMGIIMKHLKELKIDHFDQNFKESCSLKVKIRKCESEKIVKKLNILKNIELHYLLTQ
ncbi:IMPACT family protein [Bacteroidota bacterium]